MDYDDEPDRQFWGCFVLLMVLALAVALALLDP